MEQLQTSCHKVVQLASTAEAVEQQIQMTKTVTLFIKAVNARRGSFK